MTTSTLDYAVQENPQLAGIEEGAWERPKTLQKFFKPLKFNVTFFEEDDGSFTGALEELDLIENAPSKEDCLFALREAMKEYAQDFYNEFNLWSSAPNRKSHIPYVLKILLSSDSQLMEDMVCQHGKN
ncbi:MAG: hypothetical protein IJT20_00505 [Synergistaceae bacterium]|nr:hypothetical protein [Synergistaceae bacterium]